jgi:hypothetical protein
MKSRVLAWLLTLALVLSVSPVTPAQTGNSLQTVNATVQDWQELSDLEPGKKVLVELKNGNELEGKFVGITGSHLNLDGDGYVYNVEQREIQRVYRLKGKWSRRTTASIGALVGLVGGSIIGGRKMTKLERDPNRIPSEADEIPLITGVSLGILGGAGLGALFGGKRKGKLLYKAG